MRTLILLAVFAAPAFAQGSIFPDEATKKAARLLEPGSVSEENRAFLRTKMKDHSKEMKELSVAVATVKLSDAQRLAQAMANEPRLDRSSGAATKLPARFFELQELLRKTSQELADAAKANDLAATSTKYHQVVELCVSCHGSFKAQVQAAPTKK
ncbi:MAG: cytochrome c [Myxococcota bacterium]